MGTAYKGNSLHYHSIVQNILSTASKYKLNAGYFGDNSKHGKKRTRNIISENSLATAKDFYDKIAHGGIEKKINSNLKITKMSDGTVITMREKSKSDGSPVVDINIKPSSHTGGVKSQKIHFIQEGSK